MNNPRQEAIELCQKFLKESTLFEGELTIEEMLIRILKNQQIIMCSLNIILEDMKE